MKLFKAQIKSINDVKKFVDLTVTDANEIDVLSGRYVVDGKSIMGLFSLDLSKPVTIRYHGDDASAEQFKELAKSCIEITELA